MKRALVVVLLVGVVSVAVRAFYLHRETGEVEATTAPVTRGSVVDTISASGALEAVTTVQVGSQVSGTIAWLGADFNSIVKKGQVIARLDPSLMQAQVEQAQANVVKAQADLQGSEVGLSDAEVKLARANELGAKQLLPQTDLDAARVAVDTARAQVQSSRAQVAQAQASLSQARVNVGHATIAAPIDGIVIQRQVDVGQTVAASLQSPTIFTIAADLTKMEVNASIDESDIGRIRQGQTVTFTVDAYPNETFRGSVEQVRLQPTVVQNVTTYNTIISAPNAELKLKPGMTANVKVEVARADGAIRVPNAALRFKPTADLFASLKQAQPDDPGTGKRVWLFADGELKPVIVVTGVTDGANTAIVSPELTPGAEVVTGVTGASAAKTTSAPGAGNPLMGPQRGRGR